jgi:hypothetical protein
MPFCSKCNTRYDRLLPHKWSSRLDKVERFDTPGHISLRQMPDHFASISLEVVEEGQDVYAL